MPSRFLVRLSSPQPRIGGACLAWAHHAGGTGRVKTWEKRTPGVLKVLPAFMNQPESLFTDTTFAEMWSCQTRDPACLPSCCHQQSSGALPRCAHVPYCLIYVCGFLKRFCFFFKVTSTPNRGLELTIPRSRGTCSTDGASQVPLLFLYILKSVYFYYVCMHL